MPASFWWNPDTPTAGVFSAATARNWTQPDTNGNWVRATTIPGPTDDLFFDGGISSENCTIPDQSPVAPAVAFNGLHLKFGWFSASRVGPPTWTAYSGTVTIKDSFAVGTLEMESGAIKQADQVGMNPPVPLIQFAGTLTVNSNLTWTGGTLNSNYVAGKIDLAPGASGVAEPSELADYSVKLGSTFTLSSNGNGVGSTLDVAEGTFKLTHDAARFEVANHSLISLRAPVPKLNVPPPPFAGNITIDGEDKTDTAINKGDLVVAELGRAVIRAANRGTQTGMAVVNFCAKNPKLANDGILSIEDRSEVHFIACVALGGEGGGLISGKETNKASVVVEAGCKIFCTGKTTVLIDGGALQLADLPDTSLVETVQPTVVISAPAATYAVTIKPFTRLERVDEPKGRVRLEVDGNLFNDGTIELYASRVADRNDTITLTGKLEFDSGSEFRVQWFDEPGQSREKGSEWRMIESVYSGNGDAINDAYFFSQPNPHKDVHLQDVLGTDKKLLKVKSDDFPDD